MSMVFYRNQRMTWIPDPPEESLNNNRARGFLNSSLIQGVSSRNLSQPDLLSRTFVYGC
jgi:hypothetical protein